MRIRSAIVQPVLILFLLSGPVFNAIAATAQTSSAPLTKQEILSRLSDSRRLSQAHFSTEYQKRGISFIVDENLIQGWVRGGALSFLIDGVKNAGKRPGKPQMSDPDPDQIRPAAGTDPTPKLSLLEQ